MAGEAKRPLKVFLCHASGDKPQVRALYKRLVAEGVDAWLDQEKLLPGQDWRVEIPRAVKQADVVVICLSNNSITKEGYIQKEIRFALDSAEEKPEGTIFLIPARLEDCIVPERLSGWQWVDLFEENGFARLLRSLKLRAAQASAVIEPPDYESEVKDLERRLDQLYTEGLAAFYTEDWDRACRRFQAILRERPNHKNAAEKLAQAEQQRDFAKLYTQATEAFESEKWPAAVKALEDLLGKSGEYKDAAQRLKDARKQWQLGELYLEAKKLHAAGKWQAVVRVFDQIHAVDPSHADSDGLLPSAQKELAEIKRLSDMNDLYTQGIREMDSGKWHEARTLLEKVHKAQTGYLETERLLRKVEAEIAKIEERNKRNDQINLLYEQVHGLVRSKNWRKAVEKIEEIRKLDDQFEDRDGLMEKIGAALAQEEQEVQKQNQLAAMYADAVRLMRDGKYQDALDKWHEVKAIDPKYPDRQWVQRTAKRKMDELSRPEASGRPWIVRTDWLRQKPTGSASSGMLVEELLLSSFVVLVIIVILYLIDRDILSISDSDVAARLLSLFLLGGVYGAVVAFALRRMIPKWHRKQTWTVIVGWALSHSVAWIVQENLAGGFIIAIILFTGLSIVAAIKWAMPATHAISLLLIFTGWTLAWEGGSILGTYLLNVFNTEYVWAIADPLTILLGLLFTFGIQVEGSWDILKTALFGALGFAVGNYIVDYAFALLPLPQGVGLGITLWGLIGGAILEANSRDKRRIIFSAAICGIGLLVGFHAGLVAVPVFAGQSYQVEFPEQYDVLQRVIRGLGLGLAFGILIRRISAIGALALLGSGIYLITYVVFMEFFDAPDAWTSILSGAMIGFVLGFGYGFMRKAGSVIVEVDHVNKAYEISIPPWLKRPVVAWPTLIIFVVLMWGVPVKSYVSGNQNIYLYSRPDHTNPQSGFHGVEGTMYYLCRYDLGNRRYLIADSFWDCIRGDSRGWAEVDNFRVRIWNLFVHKQL